MAGISTLYCLDRRLREIGIAFALNRAEIMSKWEMSTQVAVRRWCRKSMGR
jgi:hypothetical protein